MISLPGSLRAGKEIIMARHKANREKYFIRLGGRRIEVSREVYWAWYGGERQERYQQERDAHFGVVGFDDLNVEGMDVLGNIPSADDTQEAVERREEHQELHRALQTLPRKERKVIHQLFFQGLTIAQIARLEGLDESSIRWRRDSAIRKLKKYFKKS